MKYLPEKSTLEIFRDCLKLTSYMGGNSAKIAQARQMIKNEFRKFQHVKDQDEIEKLRFNAIKGVSNYTIFYTKTELMKDGKIKYEPRSVYESDSDDEESERLEDGQKQVN